MQYFNTNQTTVTLPKGTYFIGDLFVLMSNEKWIKICRDVDYFNGLILTMKGKNIYLLQTPQRETHYHDHKNDFCFVSRSFSIGLMKLKYADVSLNMAKVFECLGAGKIFKFKNDFKVKYYDGILKIDKYEIDTTINYFSGDDDESFNFDSDDEKESDDST